MRNAFITILACLTLACSNGNGHSPADAGADIADPPSDTLGEVAHDVPATEVSSEVATDVVEVPDAASEVTDAESDSSVPDAASDVDIGGADVAGVDAGPIDTDDDGVPDDEDNCPAVANEDQADLDKDGDGDVCDPDKDGDFIVNAEDNCPEVSNGGQEDVDDDGEGDVCDEDPDGDGLVGEDDNCPYDDNPGQDDFDEDGLGDECDPDDDQDGVPDLADEAPFDAVWPGLAIDGAIYAHTSSTLYTFDPVQGAIETVGAFVFPNGGQQMTDIAIDYEGRLFGVSFNNLYRCSAKNAECLHLGGLPSSFNGMTVVPVGTLEPGEESLIGIGNNGSWNQVEVVGNQAVITPLGSYGGGYSSAGDAYSIEGVGTFAAVNKFGQSATLLVKVDPAVGTVIEEIGPMTGYFSIYGLASDGETAYAFDAGGAILALDVLTGNVSVALPSSAGKSWWGAGVTTRYFGKE